MSRSDRHADRWAVAEGDDRPLAVSALLSALAAFVALWSYSTVIVPGGWAPLAISLIIIVMLTGLALRRLLRRRRRSSRELLTLLGQLGAAVGVLTFAVAAQGALLGIIPTPATLEVVRALTVQASGEIAFGTAPLQDTPALRAVVGMGFAAIAVLLDHLMAHRLALLSALVIAAVGAVPMIVTFGDADVLWFVMFAVVVLLLLRHAAGRDPAAPRRSSSAVAVSIGAAAVVLALVVAPGLPVSATWAGLGTGVNLNPTLRLGEDLRRPVASEVLTLATEEPTAPYLRIATLSRFDGRVWHPDEADLQDLDEGFGGPEWGEQIETRDQRTSIRVLGVSSSWLPVPYPATDVQGVSSRWEVMPLNRTVVSDTEDAAGEDYTVTSAVVEPTLEQIQSVKAGGAPMDEVGDLPAVIAATAADVTAGISSDYDRLIALQNWFRTEFEYSLETPVEEDFDGTGADAVARFLDVRSGYCIHFAGAFALMAQTLEMPVRVVVGYLPGSRTDERRGDETIYSVSSDQLHAWPEVHFEGIGWVPFEPTASLGVPTAFLPSITGGGEVSTPTAPIPTTAPSDAPTTGPDRRLEETEAPTAGGGELRRLDPTPVLLVSFGILIVLLLPSVSRRVIRMVRTARAGDGDATAAWVEVRDTLSDLGLPVSEADTPRLRARHLLERGADPRDVDLLVVAIERRSYAPEAASEGDLSAAVAHVVRVLHRSVDGRARMAAVLLPRSLFLPRTSRGPRPV